MDLPAPVFRPAQTIDPSFLPHPSPFEGVYTPNDRLTKAVRVFEGQVNGSESIAVAPDGSLYLFDRSGTVLHATELGPTAEPQLHAAAVAHIGGGRTLGAHFDREGNLIFCHPPVGLMMLEKGTRRPVLLTSRVDGPAAAGAAAVDWLRYPNDLDIDIWSEEGGIYFTDSGVVPPALNGQGFYDTMWGYLMTSLHGGATGRLLKYNPKDGSTAVIAGNMWFSNGVALNEDGMFVAVAETTSMRVRRVYIAGPKAGTVDTLIDRLPGFPDGVTRGDDGNFWVCIVAPPAPLLQKLLPYPALRTLAAHVMRFKRPPVKPQAALVKVSAAGQVLDFLMDSTGQHVSTIASVTQKGSRLYMGSLAQSYIAYLDLPELEGADDVEAGEE
jgi:sugar lactone lactonase YvrE